jgi:hypothetical protein
MNHYYDEQIHRKRQIKTLNGHLSHSVAKVIHVGSFS